MKKVLVVLLLLMPFLAEAGMAPARGGRGGWDDRTSIIDPKCDAAIVRLWESHFWRVAIERKPDVLIITLLVEVDEEGVEELADLMEQTIKVMEKYSSRISDYHEFSLISAEGKPLLRGLYGDLRNKTKEDYEILLKGRR